MIIIKRFIQILLIGVYIYFILSKTILDRATQDERIFRGLFWEIESGYWSDIFLNIILFAPFGFLVGGKKGILISFALSCGIEVYQYYHRIGFCEIDDIVNNTVGSIIGAVTRSWLNKLFKVKKDNTYV